MERGGKLGLTRMCRRISARLIEMGVFSGVGKKYFVGLISAAKAGFGGTAVIAAVKRVREDSVVPPGLESFSLLFPALKRWAKLVRPSGAAFSRSSFHRIAKTSVLTHTLKSVRESSVVPPGLESSSPLFPALKRRAIFGRPSGAGFPCISYHWVDRKRVLTHTLKRWAKFGRPSGAGFSLLTVPQAVSGWLL